MALSQIYIKGARVWIPSKQIVWIGATVLENYKEKSKSLKISIDDDFSYILDSETDYYTEKEFDYIVQKSPGAVSDMPPLRNPEMLIGKNDLTMMSHLNEPEVLYNLKVRFCDYREIYTKCGIILVAINPYKYLPIYDNEMIRTYQGQDLTNLDPHIYAIAEDAYRRLTTYNENQSVIVSGESGAGKTVSAKYIMRYFAAITSSAKSEASSETNIEKKVLASNPLSEAIGNAQTVRNNNSSRFGKFIELIFRGIPFRIVGATMKTYLLEKSRVVFQSPGERSYHIFYQLCAAHKKSELLKGLPLQDAKNFFYINQGNSFVVDGIDDLEDFTLTVEAMKLLDISTEDQRSIFATMAGVLNLGNVHFSSKDRSDTAEISSAASKEALKKVMEIFECDVEQLSFWMCHRSIKSVHEVIKKPLTCEEATQARDALSKYIYARLFDWLIDYINKSLQHSATPANEKVQQKKFFIGVLDIYGFETFKVNSFEQFCINYANEKIQQQFNLHVFKLEQEEYVREGLEWSFIDFNDNQQCINLIENKLGILDLLDDECKMPQGSDKNWCEKLFRTHLQKNPYFNKLKMSSEHFVISHYADTVPYHSEGFLEKNRDTVLEETLLVFKLSKNKFIENLLQDPDTDLEASGSKGGRAAVSGPSNQKKAMKKTVGFQFKESLKQLMDVLNSSTPHYVRCIKPNDTKTPFEFESTRTVQQLRACGVLETVRLSAAGYPSRWTYEDFVLRYKIIAPSSHFDRKLIKKSSEKILQFAIPDGDKYRLGKTKIFFRAGQVAFLEQLRSERLEKSVLVIQSHVRAWLARRRFLRLRKTIVKLQALARAYKVRQQLHVMRQHAAATRIRAFYLGRKQRREFLRLMNRKEHDRAVSKEKEKTSFAAIKIQAVVRAWLYHRRFKKLRKIVIILQSHFRRRKAKKFYLRLKAQANSMESIHSLNKGLENKIISLTQQLDARQKELENIKDNTSRPSPAKSEQMRAELNKISSLTEELAKLKMELQKERLDNRKLHSNCQKHTEEFSKTISKIESENQLLKKKVDENDKVLARKQSELLTAKQKVQECVRSERDLEAERTMYEHQIKLFKNQVNQLQSRLNQEINQEISHLRRQYSEQQADEEAVKLERDRFYEEKMNDYAEKVAELEQQLYASRGDDVESHSATKQKLLEYEREMARLKQASDSQTYISQAQFQAEAKAHYESKLSDYAHKVSELELKLSHDDELKQTERDLYAKKIGEYEKAMDDIQTRLQTNFSAARHSTASTALATATTSTKTDKIRAYEQKIRELQNHTLHGGSDLKDGDRAMYEQQIEGFQQEIARLTASLEQEAAQYREKIQADKAEIEKHSRRIHQLEARANVLTTTGSGSEQQTAEKAAVYQEISQCQELIESLQHSIADNRRKLDGDASAASFANQQQSNLQPQPQRTAFHAFTHEGGQDNENVQIDRYLKSLDADGQHEFEYDDIEAVDGGIGLSDEDILLLSKNSQFALKVLIRYLNRNRHLEYRLDESNDRRDWVDTSVAYRFSALQSQSLLKGLASGPEAEMHDFYQSRCGDLERRNILLERQLAEYRELVADNKKKKDFLKEVMEMEDKLKQKDDEIDNLKRMLSHKIKGLVDTYYNGEAGLVNKDGELLMAYEAIKQVNRKLESDLQRTLKISEDISNKYNDHLENCRIEKAEKDELISKFGEILGDQERHVDSRVEEIASYTLMKLSSDIIRLNEMHEQDTDLNHRISSLLRNVLCLARVSNVLPQSVVANVEGAAELDNMQSLYMYQTFPLRHLLEAVEQPMRQYITELEEQGVSQTAVSANIVARPQGTLGLLRYDQVDEDRVIHILITGMKPGLVASEKPKCLPGFLLFMAIRYCDNINNEEMVSSLIMKIVSATKHCIENTDEIYVVYLWFTNIYRLVQCMQQYSGEQEYLAGNSAEQNQAVLVNFDLSILRQNLKRFLSSLFEVMLKRVLTNLLPSRLICEAILFHNALSSLGAVVENSSRRVTIGNEAKNSADNNLNYANRMDLLLKTLSQIYKNLQIFGIEQETLVQFFNNIFYHICANSMNILMASKELCNFSKAMQIKYNITTMRTWLEENGLAKSGCEEWLLPLTEASQLLQTTRTFDSINDIPEFCQHLNTEQIRTLLRFFTPSDGNGKRVRVELIDRIVERLNQTRSAKSQLRGGETENFRSESSETLQAIVESSELRYHTDRIFPLRIRYQPSQVSLKSIILPEEFSRFAQFITII